MTTQNQKPVQTEANFTSQLVNYIHGLGPVYLLRFVSELTPKDRQTFLASYGPQDSNPGPSTSPAPSASSASAGSAAAPKKRRTRSRSRAAAPKATPSIPSGQTFVDPENADNQWVSGTRGARPAWVREYVETHGLESFMTLSTS